MSLDQAYLDACFTVFAGLSRQGPGSVSSTRKAVSLLPPLPEGTVLDLGCGTGASTLVLADVLGRTICASDVNAASLETLRGRAQAAGLADRITTAIASADGTGEAEESAALIWCEGAVFTVGVEKGLRHWHSILKPGGVAVFSEMVWFDAVRPPEADAFFRQCYPPMMDVAGLVALCSTCGFRFHASFKSPDSDWTDEYFAVLSPALERYRGSSDANIRAVVAECEREQEIARKYLGSYGYAFVVLQKV